jgi:hypothetical protein
MKNPNLDLEKSIWNLEKISSPSWNLEKRLEKIKKNFWFQKKSLLAQKTHEFHMHRVGSRCRT